MTRRRSLREWRDQILRRIVLPLLFPRNLGSYLLDEKWDNLIILDACRYDVFREVVQASGLHGVLTSRISRGTDTASFLRENFASSAPLDDTVYVTSNPWVSKLLAGKFFEIVPVWKGGWDEEKRTVLPETVFESAKEAIKRYPGKRFIIHFFQPHAPFLGYHGFAGLPRRRVPRPLLVYTRRDSYHWPSVTRETLIWLHKRNLLLVLPYLRELLKVLPGTTVVTADHGDAMGELLHPLIPIRVYQHPPGARIPALVTVPWFAVRSSQSRELPSKETLGRPEEITAEEESIIQDRLSALGYI